MNRHVDQHIERHLGPIAMGWRPAGEPSGVAVCLFRDQPLPGVLTYSTLGLSHHVLTMPDERSVRQELMLATHARDGQADLPNVLFHVAESVVQEHRALLCGEIISLGHPIVSGSRCTDLYVSLPVIFPDGLEVYHGTEPPTVFAWLFPITAEEVNMIRQLGSTRFEDDLERRDPDLFDLHRCS